MDVCDSLKAKHIQHSTIKFFFCTHASVVEKMATPSLHGYAFASKKVRGGAVQQSPERPGKQEPTKEATPGPYVQTFYHEAVQYQGSQFSQLSAAEKSALQFVQVGA